jgi:hypothetical protein
MSKTFTEDDVNAAVKKVVDEKTKDGAFVFHDPKLDADLNLNFKKAELMIFRDFPPLTEMLTAAWSSAVMTTDTWK